MHIKVLVRDDQEYAKQTLYDRPRLFKNVTPELHPFEKPREYKRALNAAKMDRIFAKPFIGCLAGHSDGVYCLARHHENLTWLASGACDGEIRLWNASTRQSTGDWKAHSGFVRGITFGWNANRLYSVGSDKLIQLWELPQVLISGIQEDKEEPKPISTWLGTLPFQGIDHQRKSSLFATTAGNILNVWDPERSQPLQLLKWGEDSLNTVKFNSIENYVLATTCEDRSITLYDIRGNTPIKKLIMTMKSNCLSWNPMEAFNFVFGCEDQNAYSFDMRNLQKAKHVHTDHVSAILAIDYSPTGREFATGSYDKSIRIYPADTEHSREIYYTKRMQRIFSVCYSGDATYVFSGSDDTNIRIWKADASQDLRVQHPRAIEKQNYRKALIERYKEAPEIKSITTRRFVPKPIKTVQKTKAIMKKSQRQKLDNRIRHAKPGSVKDVPKKEKSIVKNVS